MEIRETTLKAGEFYRLHPEESEARKAMMCLRRLQGQTLEQIAADYNLTRERVRQITQGIKKPHTVKVVIKKRKPTDEERFWRRVQKGGPDDCWYWKGYIGPVGYGNLHFHGKSTNAHRVSYEIANGEIPAGICVLHKCDNSTCVNPKHLYLGSQQDNVNDREDRKRSNREFRLSEGLVQKIKTDLLTMKVSEVSRKYKLPYINILNIAHGKTYKWVEVWYPDDPAQEVTHAIITSRGVERVKAP